MSNRHRRVRHYQATMKRIPITGGLRDELSMVLHTSLLCLDTHPNADAFNNLAGIFNMLSIALADDEMHQHEARLIAGGAATLNQVMRKVDAGMKLAPHESAPIRVAITTMDGLIGRMSLNSLIEAIETLESMSYSELERAAC